MAVFLRAHFTSFSAGVSSISVYFGLLIFKALLMEFAVNNITSNKFALCKALWLKWQAALRVVKVHLLFPCKVHLHIEEEEQTGEIVVEVDEDGLWDS